MSTGRKRALKFWTTELLNNAATITHVQLLWRKGNPGAGYVPITVFNVDLAGCLKWSEDEWRENLHPDSLQLWTPPANEDGIEAYAASVAASMWALAEDFAARKGPVLDVQLNGLVLRANADPQLVFQRGIRCNMSGEVASALDDGREDDEGPANPWEHFESLTTKLEERLDRERQRVDESAERWSGYLFGAIDKLNETASGAPALMTESTQILRMALGGVRDLVEEHRRKDSRDEELILRAFEAEKSAQKWQNISHTVTDAITVATHELGRLGDRYLDRMFGQPAGEPAPISFDSAQQCLAFLALTLNEDQLRELFTASGEQGEEWRTRAKSFLEVFEEASRIQNERVCLTELGQVVAVFRSGRWGKVADPAQREAARYILFRSAVYRAASSA